MQTLEALLEKKVPDDYMREYKKTINSKLQISTDKVRSESTGCDQPKQNGNGRVISPVSGVLSSNHLVKTMPLTALSSNGVAGSGVYKIVQNGSLSSDGGKNGSVQIRAVNATSKFLSSHRRILPAGPLDETLRLSGPSNTDGRKKFKMSTVPKVVPLINTVGNQSKLLPLQTSSVPPSTEVGQSSVSSVSPQAKSLSILEARLSTKQVGGPPTTSNDTESNSVSKISNVSESSEGLLLNGSATPSDKVSSNQGYVVQKNRKTTISFERGATRVVSSKAKNTQTVDIGVQVYMPDPDEDLDGNTVASPNLIPPLQPISTSTSGPMHSAAPTTTMPTNEYVILDTKNGKRLITIPKQMASSKKFVKSSSISQSTFSNVTTNKSILLSDSLFSQNRSNLVTAASLPCDTVTTPSSNSVVLSVATPKGAARSIQAVLGSSAVSFKQNLSSDRLVLPLNSPVTIGGQLSSTDPLADPITLSQSRFQISTNNSDSFTLPLNSPICSTSINRQNNSDLNTVPNTSSLFILVPNDINQGTPIENKPSETVTGHSNVLKRKANGLINGNTTFKKSCLELSKSSSDAGEACVKGGMQQHSNGLNQSPPDATVSVTSNETPAPISTEDMNSLVKNAFSEFKNCLAADKDGKLPIHSAVENNDLAAVKRQCLLLRARRSSVDVPTSKDESPLQLALYHGHSSIATLLLQQGADASIVDQEGNTALHLAVMYAEDIFESLSLSKQCSQEIVNNLNDEGFSALHIAAESNKLKAIQWLMNNGAKVDLPDGKSGRTALFLAIERKSYNAQKVLLSFGADMREPTFSGSTPFLLTKADTIAHLTSGQDAVAEFIDSDALLRSTSPSEED